MGPVDGIAAGGARVAFAHALAARADAIVPQADVAVVATAASPRPPLFADAAAALADLGSGPLEPTGAVRDAMTAGRLLRTGSGARLDRLERILREGPIDRTGGHLTGAGINGPLARVSISDPLDPGAAGLLAVEKPAAAQAAQEELGWRLARAMGIDHLVPAVARRADGTARIEFRDGRALSLAGITDLDRLDQALAKSYLDDAALGLTPAEAAQAARVDRQLLQVFDYLLANNDRHLTNGLYDARRGVSFIDTGHAGRGTVATNGGTQLEPALRLFQAGHAGGRVDLDGAVVAYLQRRLDAGAIRAMHAAVFDTVGIAGPEHGSIGQRFLGHVGGSGYREGMVQRLDHVVAHRSYTHRPPTGSDIDVPLPMENAHERMAAAVGLRNVRAAFLQADMF